MKLKSLCVGVTSLALAVAAPAALAADAQVTVGSPPDLTPRNHQNEPAVAMDAHQPNLLVSGTNDFIDQQPCPESIALSEARCDDFIAPVGLSGVYFSFDGGLSWIQPTYTGWT
ncbi:MAG: hypothetical protein M3292_00970, partial [Actinomycetota bacterium]|nr:hypothetical protein [Actinomycetota bacterium]